MQSQNQDNPSQKTEPITLRDVLHAVFLPPRESLDEGRIPPISAHIRRHLVFSSQAISTPDLTQLKEPTSLVYESQQTLALTTTTIRRILFVGLGSVLAILVGYLAQAVLVANAQDAFGAILLYLAAVGIWIAFLALEVTPPDGGLLRRGPRVAGGGSARPLGRDWPATSLVTRAVLIGMALTLSGATYVFTAGNMFTLPGVCAWILSVLGWLTALAERRPEHLIQAVLHRIRSVGRSSLRIKPTAQHLIIGGLVLAIMSAAIFFRFYRLTDIPGEMTSDHVEKLLDAYDVSQGQFHVFFPRNGGREAIQMYLVALASKLFGTGMSHLTLKLVTAIEALTLVPLIIWLGRELVDWETGLFAAGLLAISWWDTSLGRLGLRIVLTPLVFSCLLIALIRGMRTGFRRSWIWAGIWLGVGVYCYQAMRLAPLVAIAAFVIAVAGPVLRAVRSEWRESSDAAAHRMIAVNIVARQTTNLAVCGIVALSIFVPMLRYWHDDPGDLWNRVVNRTTSNEVPITGSPVQIFLQNYQNALGMYNVRGDVAWINSPPGAPALDLLTGALLILGVTAWLMRLRVRRDPVDVLILVAGLIMLLPSALAIAFPIENPSLTRASGTLPVAMMLAAWPLTLVRQRWHMIMGAHAGNVLAGALIAVVFAGAGALNYETYFVKFNDSYRLSALNPAAVAHAVRDVVGRDNSLAGVWLIGWPYWHDYRAIGIDAGDITFHNAILDSATLEGDFADLSVSFSVRPLVFIIAEQDTEARTFLHTKFPTGFLEHFIGLSAKHNFYLFIVPPDR